MDTMMMNSRPRRLVLLPVFLAFILGGLFAGEVVAQQKKFHKDSPKVKEAFRQVVAPVRSSVVEIECLDGDQKSKVVALGTIVGANGWILTKASELSGEITCKVPGKGHHRAKIVGVHQAYDLAMLKIDADDLRAVAFNQSSQYFAGKWVAAAGGDQDPIAVGVVSVSRREIPADQGVLGVMIEQTDDGPRVVQVLRQSAAEKAGVKVDDVVTHVDGKRTQSREDLVRTIQNYHAGTRVKVTILRGEDDPVIMEAVLQSRQPHFQDRMSQPLSQRSAGFPSAIQHDTVLNPNQCGGPLVGLDGRVMAINIARAGRVVSYAIPGDVVVGLLPDLKSGKLAPADSLASTSQAPDGPVMP